MYVEIHSEVMRQILKTLLLIHGDNPEAEAEINTGIGGYVEFYVRTNIITVLRITCPKSNTVPDLENGGGGEIAFIYNGDHDDKKDHVGFSHPRVNLRDLNRTLITIDNNVAGIRAEKGWEEVPKETWYRFEFRNDKLERSTFDLYKNQP